MRIRQSLLSLGTLLCLASAAVAADKPVLTVYTYDSFSSEWGPGPAIEKNFESQCACDLQFVAVDDSTGILSRVRLEGNSSEADIVLGIDSSQAADAQATGLLAEHNLDLSSLELPITWDNTQLVPFDFGYFAFNYNADRLANPPGSFNELINADPELKIIIQDPRSSTPGLGLLLWVKSVYGDDAPAVWAKLQPRIVTVTKGWWEAWSLFLEGEADMVLSYSTSPAYKIHVENENQWHAAPFSDGHYMQVEVAGKLANSDQPELADAFLQFMLQEGFQSTIATGNWMYPASPGNTALPSAFDNLIEPSKVHFLDATTVKQNRKTWINEFNSALSGS